MRGRGLSIAAAMAAALVAGTASAAPAQQTTVLVSRADGPSGAPLRASLPTLARGGGLVGFHHFGDRGYALVRDVAAGTTTIASRADGADGAIANGQGASSFPRLSGDGNVMVFGTVTSTNVSPVEWALYARDLDTHDTELVSRSPTGGYLATDSGIPSADGSRVAFTAEDGSSGVNRVFVRDRTAGTTVVASRDDGPLAAPIGGRLVAFSADGDAVLFLSDGDFDYNDEGSLYLRRLSTGTTTLLRPEPIVQADVSGDGRRVVYALGGQIHLMDTDSGVATVASRADGADGAPGDAPSGSPAISDDGDHVGFVSGADNLDGATGPLQAFVRDLRTHDTALLSRGVAGAPSDQHVRGLALSPDGGTVAFVTAGTNLVPDFPGGADYAYARGDFDTDPPDDALRAELALVPERIVMGESVTAHTGVRFAEGPVESWRLDWGDGSAAAEGTGVPPAALTHRYELPGVHEVSLTVVAAGESARDAELLTVTRIPTALQAEPVVSVARPARLAGTLGERRPGQAAQPLAGRTLSFHAGGAELCRATTDAAGVGTCERGDAWTQAVAAGSYSVRFGGDADHEPSSGRATLP